MIKIALGTASKYKIASIEKVLNELEIDHELKFSDVDSGVSEQPHEKGEIKKGSINRAKNILQKFPECDIGLGVEFGYEPIDQGKFHMICWATIADKKGNIFSEHSSSLELPKKLVDDLENNRPLDVTHEEMIPQLIHSQLGRHMMVMLKKRKVIYECVENVLLRYMMGELY